MSRFDLSTSKALWNRTGLALNSDEILIQLLDRGELEAWRAEPVEPYPAVPPPADDLA